MRLRVHRAVLLINGVNRRRRSEAWKVTAGLAESNDSLLGTAEFTSNVTCRPSALETGDQHQLLLSTSGEVVKLLLS